MLTEYYRGVNIPVEAIREGFEHVVELTGLMGRWQVLQENPKVVCDTGHNAGGWQYLQIQLEEELKRHKHLFMIVGMVNDKDISSVLKLLPKNAIYYFTKASVKRALPENELLKQAEEAGLTGTAYPTVVDAVQAAKKNCLPKDLIFVGGSSFIVADLLTNRDTLDLH